MDYVDWIVFQNNQNDNQNGSLSAVTSLPKDAITWTDLVTKTNYFIPLENYQRIVNAGAKQLEQMAQLSGPDQIFNYYNGSSQKDKAKLDDIALFPLLPFSYQNKGDDDKPTVTGNRVCDHMVLRTGFLYARHYAEVKDDPVKINGLRLAGLTSLYLPEQGGHYRAALANIDQMMCSNSSADKLSGTASLDDFAVDLVKGGAVAVKQYYLETNKIKDIRGASTLLDILDKERIPDLAKEKHIPECLVYTGGGKILGVFPPGCGKFFSREAEQLYEQVTITAQVNIGWRETTIYELSTDYKSVVGKFDQALDDRRNRRWDWRVEPPEGNINAQADTNPLPCGYSIKESVGICQRCNIRYSVRTVEEGEPVHLCSSCWHKYIAGGKKTKNNFREQFSSYAKGKGEIPNAAEPYDTLKEIADNDGYIGIIYGDANNMGSVIKGVNSLGQMRYFSAMTADAVTRVVYEALLKNLHSTQFEIIALGGDDIFIIVPGKPAYEIGLTIGKLFDRRFANHSGGAGSITMSLGICVTHSNLPVQYSFDLAMQLLKEAKKKAWLEKKGTMDWLVIENGDTAGSLIKAIRRNMLSGDPKRTLRPYTWEQAEAMKQFSASLEEADVKNRAYEFRQTLFIMQREEADLFYQYQILRHAEKNMPIRQAMDTLSQSFSLTPQGMYLARVYGQEKAAAYSPWLDAIELWDHLGGSKNG